MKKTNSSVTMRTLRTVRPGDRGTMALVEEFGDRLVCVRYRYDEEAKKCYTTAEIIVREADWTPPAPAAESDVLVWVRVRWGERELASQVKEAGGTWDKEHKLWAVPLAKVREMGLEARVEGQIDF